VKGLCDFEKISFTFFCVYGTKLRKQVSVATVLTNSSNQNSARINESWRKKPVNTSQAARIDICMHAAQQ